MHVNRTAKQEHKRALGSLKSSVVPLSIIWRSRRAPSNVHLEVNKKAFRTK